MPTQKAFKTGSEFPQLEPNTLRLYSNRVCPFAQRTRIVLLYKNIAHETVNIHLKQKPEWYLENINPLGLVPSLQKDDVIVYDSTIVNDYVDEVFPGEKLNHADPLKRAKDRMLTERYSKITGPFYKLYSAGADEKLIGELLDGLDIFDKELKSRGTTFFGGDKPMMIDFFIWPHMERVSFFGTVLPAVAITSERFPSLSAWIKEITSIPAVKETMTSGDIYKQMMAATKQGNTDIYDIGLEEKGLSILRTEAGGYVIDKNVM